MTIIAGAFHEDRSIEVDENVRLEIAENISRKGAPQHKICTPGFFAVKFCASSASDNGWIERENSLTAICGNPLLNLNGRPKGRDHSSEYLDRAPQGEWPALLNQANGTFSALSYNASEHRLLLATDLLGSRPIYYAKVGPLFIFSSTLRLLESIAAIPKRASARGLTELFVFGYPLGDRTAYSNISILRSGELLELSDSKMSRFYYGRLESRASFKTEEELAECFHQTFLEALSVRLPESKKANAFLSGGLDSRLIAAGLTEVGSTVHSVCFGDSDSQDVVYGAEIAKALGINHVTIPAPKGSPVWGSRARDALEAIKINTGFDPGDFLFSGDGGSVGLGYVYFDDQGNNFLKNANLKHAFSRFTSRWGSEMPKWILRSSHADRIAEYPFAGFFEEMARSDAEDPLRRYHLFLMYNDQKRHLTDFFENIDLHQVEYQLPFYDSRILRLTQSAPVEWFLKHKFYYNVLPKFPAPVSSLPWQSYPGHLPCPVLDGKEAKWQFDEPPTHTTYERNRDTFETFFNNVRGGRYPFAVFSPLALIAIPLYELRLKDLSYYLRGINIFADHLKRTDNDIVFE